MSKNQVIGPFLFEDNTRLTEKIICQCFNNFLLQRFGNDTNFNLLYFNKMVFVQTSLLMYDTMSMIVFLTGGLKEVILFDGLHVHQT